MTEDDRVVATVARLSVTAVKGLALHHPSSIELTHHGAADDRRFYLLDEDGVVQSLTRNGALAGLSARYDATERELEVARAGTVLSRGVLEPAGTARTPTTTDMWGLRTITGTEVAEPHWGELFSDLLGRRVRLVETSASAYDVGPVTLLSTASVEELARRSGLAAVDPRRFRMLLEVSTDQAHLEDSWDGTVLEVGGAVLRGGGGVKRCAATTRHPDTGQVDLQTLRLIMAYRGRRASVLGLGATFGTYADVLQPGTVRVGDRVRVHRSV